MFRLRLISALTSSWFQLESATSVFSQPRWMGTKMLERSPGELHTYNINREGSKASRLIKRTNATPEETAEAVTSVLQYFIEMIEDNPVTVSCRNAAAMFTRLGRTETTANLGGWWFESPQLQVLIHLQSKFHLLGLGFAEDWGIVEEADLSVYFRGDGECFMGHGLLGSSFDDQTIEQGVRFRVPSP